MSDAAPQGLVESSICLDLIPLLARKETSLPGMLIVVLLLQFNLHVLVQVTLGTCLYDVMKINSLLSEWGILQLLCCTFTTQKKKKRIKTNKQETNNNKKLSLGKSNLYLPQMYLLVFDARKRNPNL